MNNTAKIITVVGPTASGKTGISIKLAKEFQTEIISADSRLVYKDFNIGTAKPDKKEMDGIIHHLIDVADPKEDFTVGIYKKQAQTAIDKLIEKNKTPIIAGGTGFYIKALLGGLDIPEVRPDNNFRTEMDNIATENGKEFLHQILKEKDPIIAKKIHHNDKFRVIRALEVINTLGIPMSEAQKVKPYKHEIVYVGLNAKNREFLYDRVNQRVDIMLEMGLVEEVKNLINKYGKTVSILKTLGYKEICEYLDGNLTLEEATELIKKDTRNFAKRQLTWFRSNKNIHWFNIDEQSTEEIYKGILEIYNV